MEEGRQDVVGKSNKATQSEDKTTSKQAADVVIYHKGTHAFMISMFEIDIG